MRMDIAGITELVTFCNIVLSLVMYRAYHICVYLCMARMDLLLIPDILICHWYQSRDRYKMFFTFTLCLFAECSLADDTMLLYTGYNPLYIFMVWQFSRSPILTGPTVPSNATWPSLRLGRKCATNGLLRRSPEQSTAKLWTFEFLFEFFFECILKLFGVGIVSCCDRLGPVRRQTTWCGRIWEDVAGVASLIETMEVERRAM